MKENFRIVRLCALLLAILLFGPVYVLWPSMAAEGYYVCTTVSYTISWSDGTNSNSTTYHYQECEFVYSYYGGGDPGGGGSGTPPGDQEPPPGGGGGGSTTNPYDTDKNGFADCYKSVVRLTGLYINSPCNEPRTNGTHDAWDLIVPPPATVYGAPAYSVSSGVVMSVSSQKGINQQTQQLELQGYGYFVKIKDAEGNWWVYAHLKGTDADPSGVGLNVGETVTVGTKIGLCDTTGDATGPHLHLEYRLGGEWGTKTCPSVKLPLTGC